MCVCVCVFVCVCIRIFCYWRYSHQGKHLHVRIKAARDYYVDISPPILHYCSLTYCTLSSGNLALIKHGVIGFPLPYWSRLPSVRVTPEPARVCVWESVCVCAPVLRHIHCCLALRKNREHSRLPIRTETVFIYRAWRPADGHNTG